MKKFLSYVLLMFSLAFAGTTASAENYYQGGWYTDNNIGRSEILYLGDNTTDSYRRFGGTRSWCYAPGESYQTMRNIIGNEDTQITWWIDADCGSVARVCVENSYGQMGCSSYRDYGWQ